LVTRTPGAGPLGEHMNGGRMMGGGMRSMWR
jgi:hypothetical protein